SVAEALGRTRAWLQRLIAGTRPLTLQHLESILGEIGTTEEEFLAEYLRQAQSPQLAIQSDALLNPTLLLRALRGDANTSLGWPEAFRNANCTRPSPGDNFPLHPRVRRIDDAREHDRYSALAESEDWLRSFLRRSHQRRLTANETAQLSTALGVWSSLQRALGEQRRGALALELAWDLNGEAPSSPSRGDLLERTSIAVADFGFPKLGSPFMQQALAIAITSEDAHCRAKRLLGIGLLQYRLEEMQLATQTFIRVLSHPGTDSIRGVAAASYLALIYEGQGKLQKAWDTLEQIGHGLTDIAPRAQLWPLGIQARVLRGLGKLAESKVIWEEILALSPRFLSPLDQAATLVQLAEVLAELGQSGDLRTHLHHFKRLAIELEDTPLARVVLKTLQATVQSGEAITLASVRQVQAQLQAVGSKSS
ncbi:MAG: hypothetical protein AAGM22_27605, partial [Acidobacteriota bacterium]